VSTESISYMAVPISAARELPRAVPCEYSGRTPAYICVHAHTLHTPAACLCTCRMHLVLTPIPVRIPAAGGGVGAVVRLGEGKRVGVAVVGVAVVGVAVVGVAVAVAAHQIDLPTVGTTRILAVPGYFLPPALHAALGARRARTLHSGHSKLSTRGELPRTGALPRYYSTGYSTHGVAP
jgi:hypothetical protein